MPFTEPIVVERALTAPEQAAAAAYANVMEYLCEVLVKTVGQAAGVPSAAWYNNTIAYDAGTKVFRITYNPLATVSEPL